MKMIIGRKMGMTQLFEGNEVVPVTVIKAGPCYVVQKKTPQVDGYCAVQLGFEEIKKTNKPLEGHFKKANLKALRVLREMRLESEEELSKYEVGQTIKVDIFQPGELVDVVGWTKGRGFAGGVKRWGFSGGPKTHGSKFHRELGSLGQHTEPAKIFKGKKMPGHYGNERVTIHNLEVVKLDVENNLIAVKGSVPGARGGLVLIRSPKKTRK
ncbi:50S ribosomal protein L3 [Pseudothermotoga hypogea DSM 11164 = NBRC 106472]|uniref:Large ribosomal subunit protein uL3 n=2 Tax=Pseudothermotoga hypogea TaxID=57487 RepID=A0A0X1KNX7_9THEM|nr:MULTISPECIES: 50S ribosomal protein L3 [Pseudothermotoga]AJC73008.1 50S ribosomal protein L3 [Pseudothermotoga hypogea DSM 11164 = NBRC 106472]MBC7122587.1 50S ribosomal protein L3 [Pseudothermotoga sp.]MDI6862778.1 50S ribosomal protein L3 [Pseudothermotoga sp.]